MELSVSAGLFVYKKLEKVDKISMNIFSSFLKLVIPTTYLGVFFLRVFHYGFIYNRPLAIITGCIPTVFITAFLILIVVLLERKILLPFEDAVVRAQESGIKMSESDAVRCISAYKKFDIAIAIGEGTGFLLGASSTAILESLTGHVKFDFLLFVIIVAQSVGVGFLCYTIVVFRIKKILMANALRKVGVSVDADLSKTLSVAITSSVYIAMFNMITVPIGILINETSGNKLHLFLRDSVIGAVLTAFVCYITYSMLIKKIRETEKYVSKKLLTETINLSVATKESAATSVDQSTAVKEVVATVEDTTNLSLNIRDKISDVSRVAEKSKDDILAGVQSLENNIYALLDIMESNKQTIEGVKELGEKINNIWDVVTLINDVASQAKIIAFNAELEANSAGEFGKNFHIVASEVRRLSDNIIEGTKEIKEKIGEIQDASDSLIMVSEQGAVKINSGYKNIHSLKEKFDDIKCSAEITAKSSNDIADVIMQLSASNEQIYSTMKQIAIGIENFSQTTENISAASQNVKDIARIL